MSVRKKLDEYDRSLRKIKCQLQNASTESIISIDGLSIDVDNNLVLTFTDSMGIQTVSTSMEDFLEIKNNVLNYNELLLIPSPSLYEYAYVRESQGTEWLPGSMGGTYYGAGLYMWDGSEWIEDDTNIFSELQSVLTTIASLGAVAFSNDYNDLDNIPIFLDKYSGVNLIPTGEELIIEANREMAVSHLTVDGTLTIDGTLTMI